MNEQTKHNLTVKIADVEPFKLKVAETGGSILPPHYRKAEPHLGQDALRRCRRVLASGSGKEQPYTTPKCSTANRRWPTNRAASSKTSSRNWIICSATSAEPPTATNTSLIGHSNDAPPTESCLSALLIAPPQGGTHAPRPAPAPRPAAMRPEVLFFVPYSKAFLDK